MTFFSRPVGVTRQLAAVGVAGAVLTVAAGIYVQGVRQPATHVSDKLFSYPWSPGALTGVSIVTCVLHLLVLAGMLGFAGSGIAGTGRAARVGGVLAVAGTALLAAAEIASIPVRNDRTSAGAVVAVIGIFTLSIVVSAAGFILLTVATLRARQWNDWRRWTPLAHAVAATAMIGVSATKALAGGVAVYALTQVVLFAALYTEPGATPDAAPAPGRDRQQARTVSL